MKTVSITDFLTVSEIEYAAQLSDVNYIEDQIIKPNMERINAALGQENDSRFLAYLVQYILRITGNWRA